MWMSETQQPTPVTAENLPQLSHEQLVEMIVAQGKLVEQLHQKIERLKGDG